MAGYHLTISSIGLKDSYKYRKEAEMKRIFWVFLFLSLSFFGCKKEPAGSEQLTKIKSVEPAGKKLRFVFIPKAITIPVFNYAKVGAEEMARRLGNVEIIWRGPETIDPIKQKEILDSFIAQRVDGIAISCLNSNLLTPSINKAVDMGIPVVTWDSDAPKSKRIAFYGVNDFETGQIMGEELVKLLGGKGKIAILTTLGADNLERRLAGAMDILKREPGIEIVETFDCKDDFLVAKQIMEVASKKYTDLGGWLSVGGWPVFNENTLDPVDTNRIKVVSFDTIPPAPEIMKKGKAHLLIGQKYFGWGARPTQILYDIVVNHKYPENPMVFSGVDIVTQENVASYMEKWKQMERGEIFE